MANKTLHSPEAASTFKRHGKIEFWVEQIFIAIYILAVASFVWQFGPGPKISIACFVVTVLIQLLFTFAMTCKHATASAGIGYYQIGDQYFTNCLNCEGQMLAKPKGDLYNFACLHCQKMSLAANKAYVNDLASPENEHDFTLMPQPVLIKPSQSAALSLKRIGTGVIIGLTISGVATLFAIKFSQNGLEKKHEIEAHQEQLRKLRYEIKAIELQKAAIDISFNDRTKNGFPKLQKGKTNQAMLAWALVFKEIGVQEKRTDTEYKALIDQLFEKRITVLKAELKRVKSIE